MGMILLYNENFHPRFTQCTGSSYDNAEVMITEEYLRQSDEHSREAEITSKRGGGSATVVEKSHDESVVTQTFIQCE